MPTYPPPSTRFARAKWLLRVATPCLVALIALVVLSGTAFAHGPDAHPTDPDSHSDGAVDPYHVVDAATPLVGPMEANAPLPRRTDHRRRAARRMFRQHL